MTAVRVVPRRPVVVPLTTRKIRLRVLPGTAAVAASADAAKNAATQAAASAQEAKGYVDLVNMSELSIGSVTDGPTADATITGSAPNQTLSLVLPQSQVPGPPGPANELTIGTVTEGPADASITGSAPSQTLNLTLPKGNAGNAATITVGTVSTVGPSDPATVTNSGTSSAAVLDFEIPQGDDGADGKSFVWKGAYSGATAYVADDVVRDQGSSWIALQATTGNAPPSLPTTSNAYWELAAEKGVDGSGSGDVTAAGNIADGALVVGDGGGKGVKAHASGAPGSAAFADTDDFATAAQGGLADTAVQPGDLGTMAAEDAADYTKTSGLGSAAFEDTGTGAGKVPVLDGDGKLDVSTIPAVAITDTFVVSNQVSMLALTAERGDIAIRTDLNKSFVLQTDDPTTLADWKELLTPTDAVLSVAGLTGAISGSALRGALNVEDGADVTDAANVGSSIHGSSAKTTPVDADTVPLIDSAASNVLKKVTWANIKATLKSYFDTLYAATGRGLPSGGTTGQVLVKTSGTNYAVGWDDQSGGGGVTPPTSSVLPVGVWAFATRTDSLLWTADSTIAGSVVVTRNWDGSAWQNGPTQTGTWKNISGSTIAPGGGAGLAVRVT